MTIDRSRHVTSVLLLVAGLVLVPALPAAALPARGICVAQPDNGPMASGTAFILPVTGFYDVAPTGPYWSIIATRGSQGARPDAALYKAPPTTCNQLDVSADSDPGDADWVAFDNNTGRLPVQPYSADFFTQGKFMAQFVAGSKTLSTSDPGVKQPIGLGGTNSSDPSKYWIADIRDVYLTGGTTYTIKVVGGFSGLYLLHSRTNDSTTWTYTHATASAELELPKQTATIPFVDVLMQNRTATLTFKDVNIDAWYGLVVARDGWWGNAVTVQISAAAS